MDEDIEKYLRTGNPKSVMQFFGPGRPHRKNKEKRRKILEFIDIVDRFDFDFRWNYDEKNMKGVRIVYNDISRKSTLFSIEPDRHVQLQILCPLIRETYFDPWTSKHLQIIKKDIPLPDDIIHHISSFLNFGPKRPMDEALEILDKLTDNKRHNHKALTYKIPRDYFMNTSEIRLEFTLNNGVLQQLQESGDIDRIYTFIETGLGHSIPVKLSDLLSGAVPQ